jgi:hypothetical protein
MDCYHRLNLEIKILRCRSYENSSLKIKWPEGAAVEDGKKLFRIHRS